MVSPLMRIVLHLARWWIPLVVVLVGSQREALMSALFIVASLDHLDFYKDG